MTNGTGGRAWIWPGPRRNIAHSASATVTGKGSLGDTGDAHDIHADISISASATVLGKGLLGDIVPTMVFGAAATALGAGVLGTVEAIVGYTADATVVGKGLLGQIRGSLDSDSTALTALKYGPHAGI